MSDNTTYSDEILYSEFAKEDYTEKLYGIRDIIIKDINDIPMYYVDREFNIHKTTIREILDGKRKCDSFITVFESNVSPNIISIEFRQDSAYLPIKCYGFISPDSYVKSVTLQLKDILRKFHISVSFTKTKTSRNIYHSFQINFSIDIVHIYIWLLEDDIRKKISENII